MPRKHTTITVSKELYDVLTKVLDLEWEVEGNKYRSVSDMIEKWAYKRLHELERELRMRRAAEAEGVVREE